MDVLLEVARIASADATRLRQAASRVRDWDALVELARWHRVLPFVSRCFATHAPDAVEESALKRVHDAAHEVAARALASARELMRVLDGFASAGVRALAYKGPALALSAYGDVGLRDCVDLDFVVSPADLSRGREVLVSLGYRQREGMTRAQEGAVYGGQGHFPYVNDGRFVELHWRFAATRFPWNPKLDEILDRCTTVQLAGAGIAVPAREDQLLLLLLHGTRHLWAELEWTLAVAQLLGAGGLDSGVLLDRARTVGGRRAALVGLEVARRALEAPVPEALVVEASSDAHVASLAREALARLRDGPSASPLQRNNARAFHLECLERPRDRVRFVVQSTLRPTLREWELVRLPGALTLFYVPIRIGRLLLRR
jgi:hypothetical protein